MLKDLGAFIPFGAFITWDGEVQLAGGEGDSSHLETQEIVEMYLEAYRGAAVDGTFTCTALRVDVRVHVPGKLERTDAIQIMLEHSGGEALNAFIPYEKRDEKRAGSDINYAPLFAAPLDPQVFIKLGSEKEQ